MTSSGAFFDPRAVSKNSAAGLGSTGSGLGDLTSGSNNSSTDILAKLQREMMLSGSSEAVSTTSSEKIAPASATSILNNTTGSTSGVSVNEKVISAQSLINKLNLSPAKTNIAASAATSSANKEISSLTESELDKLRSRAKANIGNPNARLSLIGTTSSGTTSAAATSTVASAIAKEAKISPTTLDSILSKSQPDLSADLNPR